MSSNSWLRTLRSALAPRQSRRHLRRALLRTGLRPGFEVLEDRLTPSFSPAVSYPVASNPLAVVTGDFNGDGKLDLATANPAANKVSVLLGDGAGGFGDAIDSARDFNGANQVSFTVADFDNDGADDLAYTAQNYETGVYGGMGVLLGSGTGAFGSLTPVNTYDYAEAVAAGDFNNDGNSDLAVTGWITYGGDGDDGFVQVLLGNGQGGFAGATSYLLSVYKDGLTVGDLNADGNLDVVAVDGQYGGQSGVVLFGNGAGRFVSQYDFVLGAASWSGLPGTVAVGDLTGDGFADLVVAGAGVDTFVGRGDGTFADPVPNSANGAVQTGVAVVDVNGDGLLDVVTSDADTGTVSELLSNGDGTLTYAGAYAVGLSPSAITDGDFNGDGRPDVATADAGSNTVSVLLNNGDWTPPPPPLRALRISDRTIMEGNTGAASATFTVTLSAASIQTVTVAYATGNDTATAGSDFQATSGTLTFAPGETSKAITIKVIGDRTPEPNETFFVNLSSPTNATIADGQGIGTIVDDEPRISISDVTKSEGRKGKSTSFTFTITLSAAYDQPITVSYRTVDGTAKTSDGDYVAKTGTITFNPGETTKTITITIKGDNKKESNETFYLDLFGNSSNSLIMKSRGIGTILNDD